KIPSKTFVIYQGHHGDKAVSRADLIIPTSCFTEKEGIYVNLEGRPQISRQVKFPLPSVDHSWDFFTKLSNYLQLSLDYKNFSDLRNNMFEKYKFLSKLNQIKSSELVKPKKYKYNFAEDEMTSNINNFYMTDSVSRNSPTMSTCSLAFQKKSV
ncbi:MAG: NADH-quinone oxidoreductase subunit G, partial [Rickettsiales bacterium]|nr:NADH-quinone oxidoreductase subunit G [Rickettsiales bacterium]